MRGTVASTWIVVVAVVAGLAACDTTDAERAAIACTAICRCQEPPLPGLQKQCVNDCTGEISGLGISDECVACISAHSDRCAPIELECGPVCNTNPPVDDGGFPMSF